MSSSLSRSSSTSSSSKHHTSTSSPSPTSSPSNNSSSTSSLGKTTTIIIAVVASVGGIILILFVYRFIRHRISRRGSAPLPPVQPIAHHREQQLAQFEDRKFNSTNGSGSARNSLWAQQQQQYLMTPAPMSGSTSDASLTHRSSSPSPNVSLINHHEIALDSEKPLPHPTPAFHGTSSSRDSSSSMGSVVERSSTPNSPFPETPTSAQSHSSTQPLTRQVRPRPSSMVSTASRKSLAGTTNTIRGAPHGPHSNVQIVLPTPLAPALSPYGHVERGDDPGWLLGDGDTGSVRPRPDSRLSVVDKWAGVPVGRNEKEEERVLLAKRERNTGSGLVIHADARDSTSTSRTHSTSSSHYSPSTSQLHPQFQYKSPPPSLLRSSLSQHNNSPTRQGTGAPSIPPSSFRDHSRTPPPPAPPVPRVHNQFASAIRLDDDGSLEERGRPVLTQSNEARTRR